MRLTVALDLNHASAMVAHLIEGQIKQKPDSFIALPASGLNRLVYAYLVEAHQAQEVDFSKAHFLITSEIAGLAQTHPGSVYHQIREAFFIPCAIPEEHIHAFDGSNDPDNECRVWNQFLDAIGMLDMIVIGVGFHGHIAYNRPAETLFPRVHIEYLDEHFRQRLTLHFDDQTEVPNRIITFGVQDLLRSKKLVLSATGHAVSPVIKRLYENKLISTQFPASMIMLHPYATLVVDQDAASETGLKVVPQPDKDPGNV